MITQYAARAPYALVLERYNCCAGPVSYQVRGVLDVNVVAEADTAYGGLGKLWPEQRLTGDELPEPFDGKCIFRADVHSPCKCRNTMIKQRDLRHDACVAV